MAALHQILGHTRIESTRRYTTLSDEAMMRKTARIAGSVHS